MIIWKRKKKEKDASANMSPKYVNLEYDLKPQSLFRAFSCVCTKYYSLRCLRPGFFMISKKIFAYNYLLSSWSSSVLVKCGMLIILVVLGLVTFITMLYYVERKSCPHYYNQNTGYNYNCLAIFPENGNTCIETVGCCNPNIGTSTRAESIT